jgi:hypothetical protein
VIIEQIVNQDSSQSIQRGILSNLKKYTEYELLVIAVNGAGDSPKSTKLLVKTQQGSKYNQLNFERWKRGIQGP